jgi:phage portal protein BeeE
VAVVSAHVCSNPVLASATTVPLSQTSSNFDQPNSDGSDLFEAILNECPNSEMNSSEFKEFMKNWSCSSKGLIIFTAIF